MPREVRFITFSEAEVVQAINAYSRITPGVLPDGEVVTIGGDDQSDFFVIMKTFYGQGFQEITVNLDSFHVVEMLVRYCIENNIPVARQAVKTYKVTENRVVLRMELSPSEP